jgi:hypothetical protein
MITTEGKDLSQRYRHSDGLKRFAYIDFDDENLMLEAVKLSEDNLEGRKLLIKVSTLT